MMKIVNEEPQPITKFVSDLPPALVAAVMKALNREPARRFPHAGDFGAELRLLRLSAERASETVAGDREDLAQTMFIPSTPAAGAAAAQAGAAVATPADPAAHASLTPSTGTSGTNTIIVKGGKLSTWLAVARSGPRGGGGGDRADRAGRRNGDVQLAVDVNGIGRSTGRRARRPHPARPPSAAHVKLVSDPEGARITINGNESGVTPADIALDDIKRRARAAQQARLSRVGRQGHGVAARLRRRAREARERADGHRASR